MLTQSVGDLMSMDIDTSPGDQGSRSRRYGCSPTRVRFEDESEKEAESRYLDRVRQRGRPGTPKSKSKDSNTDSSSSGSERGRSQRSVSVPPSQRPEEAGGAGEAATVVKEIIVLVKKCEACGSVVREPQPVLPAPDPGTSEPQQPGNPEDARGKGASRPTPPSKSEPSTRPKAPLTVTFAGAYVLGENKEISTGWKSSGFGKLRRRSRKGESRLESGHGPYGPSWAQRRNSNPRNRVNLSRGVSFAPGSPIALGPSLLEASGGQRESPAPSLPIKSALKSSSRSRSAASQPPVQGGEGGAQSVPDALETRRESPLASTQGSPAASSPAPCIRPSTLRYSPARLPTDLPAAELWDAAADGAGERPPGMSSEGRSAPPSSGRCRSRTAWPPGKPPDGKGVEEEGRLVKEQLAPDSPSPPLRSPDSPQIDLHRALSVEDVMVSRVVRPVGRVTQAFPDGTLLLELVRPPNGPFGFVISRGKGRPDTGVYVEKVGDGSGEGPYVGLLGIGDEILQVNGEAVAGLSLDHVTRLMTRESTASLRIMPARRSPR
uniref:PDZ domain-containing protein n=1 Tax=Salarias fasciatus TaxID=181472 RepID=A0A672IZ47_SALFA